MIELRRLTRVYGAGRARHLALDGIDLDVAAGELVALTGPSGSGKSTLLQILGCLDRPTSGHYRFAGVDVGGLDRARQARFRNRYIGFVFQAFHLLDDATALENVALPLVYAGAGADERRRRAARALAQVGIAALAHRRPAEMSGGQRQRVAVARALVTEPPLVLADEPTGNLDSRSTADVLDLLRAIHADGKTVVVVTHDEAVAAVATRRLEVRDGRVEART
ncbi:MAG TPA: ABC transporter ATP-binding protein [Kofleriaceae bacterium]|nr:ABC transporter ATP-binding protein [Kofleriaceae bacterium]